MIVSASSGTTSQAIFSITSRLAFDRAARNIASPPSAGGGTTLREGLWVDEGTGRRGVGAGDATSSTTSSSSGISSSSSMGGDAGGGLDAAGGGGLDGGGAGRAGGAGETGADVRAAGGPGTGGFAAGGAGLAAARGAGIAGGEGGRAGVESGGFDRAPPRHGGRGITLLLPLPPGGTAGPSPCGGGAGGGGGAPRPLAAPAAGGTARVALWVSARV